MSALSLRLPDSLHNHIRELAQQEGVSINQLTTTAIAEKMSALWTEDYLQQRAKKGSRAKFKRILDQVPSRKPIDGDERE